MTHHSKQGSMSVTSSSSPYSSHSFSSGGHRRQHSPLGVKGLPYSQSTSAQSTNCRTAEGRGAHIRGEERYLLTTPLPSDM